MASIAPRQTWNTTPAARIEEPARPKSFSNLHWSVIALARRDPVSSVARGGVLARIAAWFGLRQPSRLADDRLEALRRIAVLAWRDGYLIDADEISRFLQAGFDLTQYELLQRWVRDTRLQGREQQA